MFLFWKSGMVDDADGADWRSVVVRSTCTRMRQVLGKLKKKRKLPN